MNFNRLRNILLLALLMIVQYQIFAGHQGLAVRSQLVSELDDLKVQQDQLEKANQRLVQGSHDKHSDELHQEVLRQVYHMVAPGETFEKL